MFPAQAEALPLGAHLLSIWKHHCASDIKTYMTRSGKKENKWGLNQVRKREKVSLFVPINITLKEIVILS